MTDATTILHAQLEVRGCTAELWLNDIPVVRIAASPTRIPLENAAVAHLVVPGINTLELLVEPGRRPSTARSESRVLDPRGMAATARLIAFSEGASGLPDSGECLVELDYRGDAAVDRETFPRAFKRTIDLGDAHGRWRWQDAPRLVLDAALRREARAVLAEVADAVQRLDAVRFWALTERQLRDVQRAYPAVTDAYLRDDLSARFADLARAQDRVLARDPASEDFRLVGEGRLLECIDRDWTTTLKLREPDSGAAIPYTILLARLDGALQIVR